MKAATVSRTPRVSAIADTDFLKFRDFFYRKTGIHFDESKRYFVDKRLVERIEATGAENFRSYFVNLRFESGTSELQNLVNAMTVNETYFFREAYQFDCMVKDLLGDITKRKRSGDRIRIWSVPSSTGEEPYSIAIYLLERWAQIEDYEVEIFSSDIDTEVLAAAQKGVYSARSVANLPKAYLEKYFQKLNDNEFAISRDLVSAVEFNRTTGLCTHRCKLSVGVTPSSGDAQLLAFEGGVGGQWHGAAPAHGFADRTLGGHTQPGCAVHQHRQGLRHILTVGTNLDTQGTLPCGR